MCPNKCSTATRTITCRYTFAPLCIFCLLISEYGNPPSCWPHKVSHLFLLRGRKIGLKSFFHLEVVWLFPVLFDCIEAVGEDRECAPEYSLKYSELRSNTVDYLTSCNNDIWLGDCCFCICVELWDSCGLLNLGLLGSASVCLSSVAGLIAVKVACGRRFS